jgi:uncharacterized protein
MARAFVLCILVALTGAAQTLNIPRPAEREFVVDSTSMVNAPDKDRIMTLCDRLLTERDIPVVVLTIQSMAAHTQQNISIGGFARLLFNQWGAEHQTVHGAAWNRGILLLISREDRKARIELGSEWDRSYNGACKAIMNEVIVPSFQRGDYSGGIAAGVVELDRMARGQRPPSTGWGSMPSYNPTASPWFLLVMVVLAGAMRVWRFISYYGGNGYGGRGYYDDTYYHNRPYGGSGYSSVGSSRGGSSRGGGATGSW